MKKDFRLILILLLFFVFSGTSIAYAATLSGTIYDTDKNPLEDVNIQAESGEQTTSAADGTYSIDLSSSGKLSFSRDGYRFFSPASYVFLDGDNPLTLDKYGTRVKVLGFVKNSHSGDPAAEGIDLELEAIDGTNTVPFCAFDGFFSTNISAGSGKRDYVLTVDDPRFKKYEKQVAIRDDVSVNVFNVELVPAKLDMTIRDYNGDPVPFPFVRITQRSGSLSAVAIGDEVGRVVKHTRGIPTGDYSIDVYPENAQLQKFSGTVSITKGEINSFNITLEKNNETIKKIKVESATSAALKAAVAEANASSGLVIIEFAKDLEIPIDSQLVLNNINGQRIIVQGASGTIIRRGSLDPNTPMVVIKNDAVLFVDMLFDGKGGKVLEVDADSGQLVRFSNCSVRNGIQTDDAVLLNGTGFAVLDNNILSGKINVSTKCLLGKNTISVDKSNMAVVFNKKAGQNLDSVHAFDNTIQGGVQVYTTNVYFRDNTIVSDSIDALYIDHGAPLSYYLNNTISGRFTNGVRLIRCRAYFSGNTINGEAGTSQYGFIGENLSSSKTIVNNTISGVSEAGIRLTSAGTEWFFVYENSISGNPKYGIYLEGLQRTRLIKNEIKGAKEAGILIKDCSDFDAFALNEVSKGTGKGIYFTGTNTGFKFRYDKYVDNQTGIYSEGILDNVVFIDENAFQNTVKDWDINSTGAIRVFNSYAEKAYFLSEPDVVENSVLGEVDGLGPTMPLQPVVDYYRIRVNDGTYVLKFTSEDGVVSWVTRPESGDVDPIQLGSSLKSSTGSSTITGPVVQGLLNSSLQVQLRGANGFSLPGQVEPSVLNPMVQPVIDVGGGTDYVWPGRLNSRSIRIINAGSVRDRYYLSYKLNKQNWNGKMIINGQDVSSQVFYTDTDRPLAERYQTEYIIPGTYLEVEVMINPLAGTKGTAKFEMKLVSTADPEESVTKSFNYEIMHSPKVTGKKPALVFRPEDRKTVLYFNRSESAAQVQSSAFAIASSESATIYVYDLSGKVVLTQDLSISASGYTIAVLDTSSLSRGVYVYQLVEDGTVTARGKIAITQ